MNLLPTLPRRSFLGSLVALLGLPLVARATPERTGQPRPLFTLKAVFRGVTSVTRKWREEDVPRCRLCDACTAHKGVCMVLVAREISNEDAPLLSIVGSVRNQRR